MSFVVAIVIVKLSTKLVCLSLIVWTIHYEISLVKEHPWIRNTFQWAVLTSNKYYAKYSLSAMLPCCYDTDTIIDLDFHDIVGKFLKDKNIPWIV